MKNTRLIAIIIALLICIALAYSNYHDSSTESS